MGGGGVGDADEADSRLLKQNNCMAADDMTAAV